LPRCSRSKRGRGVAMSRQSRAALDDACGAEREAVRRTDGTALYIRAYCIRDSSLSSISPMKCAGDTFCHNIVVDLAVERSACLEHFTSLEMLQRSAAAGDVMIESSTRYLVMVFSCFSGLGALGPICSSLETAMSTCGF
jgi:hypothetical protein